MTLSELRAKLQWWETICSGDTPVSVHTITNAPIISKGEIIDIFCEPCRHKGVKKVIIFGGNKK